MRQTLYIVTYHGVSDGSASPFIDQIGIAYSMEEAKQLVDDEAKVQGNNWTEYRITPVTIEH